MKTIQLTNDYDSRVIPIDKPVIASNATFFLTSITEEQKNEVVDMIQQLKRGEIRDNTRLKLRGIAEEIAIKPFVKNILKIGSTNAIKGAQLSAYIDGFMGKDTGDGRKVYYRNYAKSQKEQFKTIHLINVCEDTGASVRSAVKQMDAEFCFLWKE